MLVSFKMDAQNTHSLMAINENKGSLEGYVNLQFLGKHTCTLLKMCLSYRGGSYDSTLSLDTTDTCKNKDLMTKMVPLEIICCDI